MVISKNKLNIFFSTLNFVLVFIGYQLATSLFLPVSSDLEGISRSVTIPYRAFALLISIFVIILNFKRKSKKTSLVLVILGIYWIALIIRIFYDSVLRSDVFIIGTSQLWFYIFGIILPAMFSIMKSYTLIDLDKALKWIFIGTVLTMILSLFNNTSLLMDSSEVTDRATGNVALQTIAFGHLGTMGIVLSLIMLFKGGLNLFKKAIIIIIILLSFLIMIRAGSRSPVLALAVIILFWMFALNKNIIKGFYVAISLILLLIIFLEPILSIIGEISPIMEIRLRMGIYGGNTSGRDIIYEQAIQAFIDSPIIGSQFALFSNIGVFTYSHNIILDSLMGLGIIGGIAMAYILFDSLLSISYLIKRKDPHFWIGLILLQQIVLSMLSGAIYYNQILNFLIVFISLYTKRGIIINTSNIESYAKKE
jgi:hypothetical protein